MAGYSVEISDETGAVGDELLELLESAAITALEAENAGPVVLSIALLDDAGIAGINESYLSHTGPTDVISFPLAQPGAPLVGDIYIGAEQARRQAAEYGVSETEELVRLVVHGTLHVLGWDHPEGESSPMFARQEEIVARIAAG